MMTARQKDFMKLLEELSRHEGYRPFEALAAFLELGFCALVNPTVIGDTWQKNEDRYLERIRSFRHAKDSADVCAKALCVVVEGLEDDGGDFLGPIFTEVGTNAQAGQFFTPYHLCEAMAEITIDADVVEMAKTKIVTIMEPACGCGAMVLATAEVLKRRGVDPARRAHFTLVDVDARCVQASYIQCSLAGISADVIHGNTLSLETWGGWQTFTAFMFPKRFTIRREQAIETVAAATPTNELPIAAFAADAVPTQRPPAPATGKPLQLSFADL